jgi:murein tripeptide amidase MpaA
MVSTTVLFVLLLSVTVFGEYRRFDNHKVLLLNVVYEEDYFFLETQLHNNQSLDFWIEPRFGEVAIRVDPEAEDWFTGVLKSRGIQYSVMIDNVQNLVDEQMDEIRARGPHPKQGEGSADAFAINQYNTVADTHAWLRALPARYPALTIQLITVGNSYSGWPLLAVRISSSVRTTPKNSVWFDGGIHAREWISPATVLWMTYAICENYTAKVPDVVDLVDNLNIYVLPIFNPDGYDFTFTGDRMWRKTRRPNTDVGNSCIGTDPNRNWNNHWAEQGISRNPCAETYCGPRANSEREVEQVSSYIATLRNSDRLRGYINFHAYSQLWLSPYGWTSQLPADNSAIQTVGRNAASALATRYRTSYTVGPIYTTIYPASGSSADFAYQNAGILYSYAPELRPVGSSPGFLLPAVQIIPSGLETFDALKVWMTACK